MMMKWSSMRARDRRGSMHREGPSPPGRDEGGEEKLLAFACGGGGEAQVGPKASLGEGGTESTDEG